MRLSFINHLSITSRTALGTCETNECSSQALPNTGHYTIDATVVNACTNSEKTGIQILIVFIVKINETGLQAQYYV